MSCPETVCPDAQTACNAPPQQTRHVAAQGRELPARCRNLQVKQTTRRKTNQKKRRKNLATEPSRAETTSDRLASLADRVASQAGALDCQNRCCCLLRPRGAARERFARELPSPSPSRAADFVVLGRIVEGRPE